MSGRRAGRVLRRVVRHPVVRGLTAAACVIAGLALLAIGMAVGDCAAFGGRCPGAWSWDTYRFVLGGLVLMAGGVVLARRPDRVGLRRTLVVVVVALPVAWVLTEATRVG
jgi:hypothetical protein